MELDASTAINRDNRERWWQYAAIRQTLYRKIRNLPRCFAAAATTKYLNFSAAPTDRVFANTIYVFTTDRWDLYAVVQSTIHEVWARKYSGALETRLRYSPSDCFDTFPFPEGLWHIPDPGLAELGERYHEHRRALMLRLWLGLTDIYNLFHARDLDDRLEKHFAARARKDPDGRNIPAQHRAAALAFTHDEAHQGILELRALHQQLDEAILAAYGWSGAVPLGHDFHEIETLPENDRVRYTISPAARREILKRLLAENHARAAAETAATPVVVKPKRAKKAAVATSGSAGDIDLFLAMSYPASDTDKAICAAALAAVEQSGGLSSMDHLDTLLLATHPAWCKVFLPAADQKRLDVALAQAPAALFVGENDSIRWKDARDLLEQRKALKVDHAGRAQPISAGADLAAVKASLPAGVDEVVALALKALDRVRILRQQSVAATQEQQRILSVFRREAQSCGLAVA